MSKKLINQWGEWVEPSKEKVIPENIKVVFKKASKVKK